MPLIQDVPFETTVPIILATVSLILALLTFVVLLLNRFRRTFKRLSGKPVKHISITQNSFRFIMTILWITASAAVLFLAAFIQSYNRFTHKELVAEVRCLPLDDADDSMFLELTPIHREEKQPAREFVVMGDQWALEGDILKWDDWLNFLGIHTMYKLTRVRGRFLSVEDEVNRSPSVYSLVREEERPQWRWLYKYGHRLRFVTAVYGNTVFTYPSEENVYEVYVTTSGFIVQVAGR